VELIAADRKRRRQNPELRTSVTTSESGCA
jgi:hypothetical protein